MKISLKPDMQASLNPFLQRTRPVSHRSFALKTSLTTPPEQLLRHLSNAGHVATSDRFEVLHGGRTNQVWKFGNGFEIKVLKLYRDTNSNALFENNSHSEINCLTTLDATGLAPRLLNQGSHPLGRWIIYEHINGRSWSSDSAPVARLLARVHAQAPLAGLTSGPNGSAEIRQQTLGILARCQANSRDRINKKMPNWPVSPIDRPCLIHGDPVPGNIVLADQDPVLIDWQCPVNGDPTEDLALFLSPAMQKLYRGTPLTLDEERQFLTAYPDSKVIQRYQTLKAWYHWRMSAYCLWQLDQGNDDYLDGFDLEYDYLNAIIGQN